MFNRMVPSNNYKLNLNKLNATNATTSTVDLPLSLQGEDRGAGNGPFVTEKTILPTGTYIRTIAGK